MGRKRWLPILGLGAVLACEQELSTRERIVQRELVEDRLNSWVRVMNNAAPTRRRGPEARREQAGAMDSLFAMYAEEDDLIVIWPDGQHTQGWEEMQEGWRSLYGAIEGLNFVLQSPTVRVLSPSVAVSTFRHSTDMRRDLQQTNVRAGYGTLIWIRGEDGSWRIHLSHIGYADPGS